MYHASLYEAKSINRALFRNRIMVAPMTRISASETGVPGKKCRIITPALPGEVSVPSSPKVSILTRRGRRPMRFSQAS